MHKCKCPKDLSTEAGVAERGEGDSGGGGGGGVLIGFGIEEWFWHRQISCRK